MQYLDILRYYGASWSYRGLNAIRVLIIITADCRLWDSKHQLFSMQIDNPLVLKKSIEINRSSRSLFSKMEASSDFFEHEFFSADPPAFNVRKVYGPGNAGIYKLDLRPTTDLIFTDSGNKTLVALRLSPAMQMYFLMVLGFIGIIYKLFEGEYVHSIIMIIILLIVFLVDWLKKIQLYNQVVDYLNS